MFLYFQVIIVNNNNYGVSLRRIELSEMTPHVHSFTPRENKVDKLSKWLISWITMSLRRGKIQPHDFLPSKAEIACHLGVSLGTIQNVFRLLEDAGYIESKQKIGSYIIDRSGKSAEKLTSKRDIAMESIKKYLKDNNYKCGDTLISTRKLAQIIGVSNATVRSAITNLVLQGLLVKQKNNYCLTNRSFRCTNIEKKTLVEKSASKIKSYIIDNLSPGDKLPSSKVLSEMFNISLKTIHDSLKILSKEGIVHVRRGQYGTTVLSITDRNNLTSYNYEIIENKVREHISSNCKIGDKLPTIKALAEVYSTSAKTVKKALDNLAEDGYITFVRGRYGGTFVTDIPAKRGDAYTWLALNSEYSSNIN